MHQQAGTTLERTTALFLDTYIFGSQPQIKSKLDRTILQNMATKKSKVAPTDDELNNLLEGLDAGEVKAQAATSKGASKAAKPATSQSEQDLLAELENLGAQQPSSRPHTPRVQTIKRTSGTPPPSGSTRTSEEKASTARKSVDSTRSFHTSFTPSATSSDLQEAEKKHPVAQPAEPAPVESSGGWWGSLLSTASTAVKTAEAAVKEIQQNDEAKRWAEQVRGNVGALRGLGKRKFNSVNIVC